ncbi:MULTISPECIES: Cof-type HAD-IIB family hydrolase [Vibrio]|uniref:HAD family hydrolase n=1 Tax=Vibrio casei TaxID=673372 RepID=A0A368LJH3_9VIBR|nr:MULTISPECIES: Cof-type HAD-IIB family hydrolase [Vibrio]RCS70821.1 HAD family hydrolase [Vibrio casei]SJN30401.1 Predicted hydrolase [Vibrio casei]HBV76882.1 HAD family hydrolase [Vibrio sp.]
MTQPDIKFIASDMDGTLLNEQGKLDPDFYGLYNQLEQRGIIFAAASGRQYYSLMDTFEPLKDKMMFIAENGTLVMHQGKELYSCTIEREEVEAIIKQARLIDDAFLVLCGKRSAYIETQNPQALAEFSKYYHRCEYVEDVLSVDDEFIKIAICHFGGTEALVYPIINETFGDSHQVVVSAKIWLDVMNADASKGAAIKHLQNMLGFSFEQTMSFGDYFNDVEMLQQSYYSYAMENAHEGVKKYARFYAPSNHESGVLRVIETLLK